MQMDLFTPQMPIGKGKLICQLGSERQKFLALSWKQPFLSLMLPPHNKIETRIWETKYRGWVLMCASLQQYKPWQLFNISGPEQMFRINTALKDKDAEIYNSRGYALAIGKLVNCRRMVEADAEKTFVAFHSDLWCHIYTEVYAIRPFPWKGKQGWAEVPQQFIERIEVL